MLEILWTVLAYPVALLRTRNQLALQALALRHQITVLNRQSRRPKLRWWDRWLWLLLKRTCSDWKAALVIVQPETVIAWQRAGWRMFWRWRSRRRGGRPAKDPELINLIQRMWAMNPTWGCPRIRDELRKLGLRASTATIRKYRPTRRRRPSQGWWTFLRNHAGAIASLDFFVVPTVTFRWLYVLVVLRHERRKMVHFNITEAPSALWTAQQMVEAFPYALPPRYLLRDRDAIYGGDFTPSRGPGLGTKAHCHSVSVAESHGRTSHRLDSPRVFRPLHCPQCATPTPHPLRLSSLLDERETPRLCRGDSQSLTAPGVT